MPGLRHVLNAGLALVANQNECQGVRVRATELINARRLAGFENRSDVARFLNRDSIVCDCIVAPDLCLRLRSRDMKCAVGIESPDGAQRVSPCPGERGWTGWSGRAGTYQHDQNACEEHSQRML